ncbi:TIGR02281 family clan AA aspartic protease [Sphingomonas koreensis]|nr:TIGR02281 family clan AA aspartic protease [Sphingomonas koreensis]
MDGAIMLDYRILSSGWVALVAGVSAFLSSGIVPAPLAPGTAFDVLSNESVLRAARAPIDIVRSHDGLFYVDGRVNGVPVRFLIDTGATMMVLTARDAARVGSRGGGKGTSTMQTAGGRSTISWRRLDRVAIGGRVIHHVDAVVPEGAMQVSLLGQSMLSRLGPLTLDNDHMTIGTDQIDAEGQPNAASNLVS